MSKGKSKRESYFDEGMRHRTVEHFVVSYFNHSIKVDLGERTEHKVDSFDFHKYDESKMWSHRSPDGYYHYFRYKDERFSELDELVDRYSGSIEISDTEKDVVKKKLYSLIMLFLKEEWIEGDFRLQPHRDAELSKLTVNMERLTKLIDNLERRIRNLERLAEKGVVPR